MARKERVSKVIDGDTFKTKSRKNSVRIARVYAPDKGQPGFVKAKIQLSKLIQGEKVRIDTVARDKYRRAIANVYKGQKSVNKEMQRRLKK